MYNLHNGLSQLTSKCIEFKNSKIQEQDHIRFDKQLNHKSMVYPSIQNFIIIIQTIVSKKLQPKIGFSLIMLNNAFDNFSLVTSTGYSAVMLKFR